MFMHPRPHGRKALSVLMIVSFVFSGGDCLAEDGKALYATYCSACHGVDGKGANDGAFPPLAKSPWVNGKPDRSIQIVLHGLQGEITVPTDKDPNAKYNLVMPPQGGTLTDEQIVPILNYVRNSWGNKNEPVKLNDVVKNRRVTGARTTMWQADELLKKFPMESNQPAPIKGLVSRVYHGSWNMLPDFSKLKAVATHEEHKGLISLANANKPENFGMVWEGELPVPKDGTYTFTLDSDDGSALYIDGKLVTEVKGLGAMGRAKAGKAKLTKGLHDIRVEYFEASGGEEITLAWQGPGIRRPQSLSEAKPAVTAGPKWPSIPIDPPKGGTAFYRGFIEGSTPRAIGVGYDGGINLAFSADNLAVELLWQERFYDGGRHWTNRGQGNEPPAGKHIVKLTSQPAWGTLESPTAPWQPGNQGDAKRRFRGYQLGSQDRPVFRYEIGALQISDHPQPELNSKSLTRRLSIDVPEVGALENLHLLLANGLDVQPGASANSYLLNHKEGAMQIDIDGPAAMPALVRDKELILPLNLKPGNNLITLRYQWK